MRPLPNRHRYAAHAGSGESLPTQSEGDPVKIKNATVVAGLAAALALTAAAATPAQAAKPQPISSDTYSALGDSYAAGFGAGPMNAYGQSAQAYPFVLAGGSGVNITAVPGATTGSVAELQIPIIPDTTTQVTLTVGGNDLGFVGKAQACVMGPTACALSAEDAAKLAALRQSLAGDIASIHEMAPAATIYVTGYPLLFQALQTPGDSGSCVIGDVTSMAGKAPLVVTEGQADAMDAAAVALNGAIRSSISGSMNRYAKYVDVTAAFAGHGLCGIPSGASQVPNPDSFINPVHVNVIDGAPVVDVSSGPLHPTADGQLAYAATIRAKGFKG